MCHRALVHSCGQSLSGEGTNDGVVQWISETFRIAQGEQDTAIPD